MKKLLPEVESQSVEQLRSYIKKRAEKIVNATHPDEAWDDPEEWLNEAAELAHAIIALERKIVG